MLIKQGRVYARDIEDAIDRINEALREQGLTPAGDYRIWAALVQDKLPDLIWYEYNATVEGAEA